ncbi:MAG: hypothetical protein KA998_03080 [Rickettsiaceae bacterium]|nr:hypothetical protein [Rickettsiaceae bacterium]
MSKKVLRDQRKIFLEDIASCKLERQSVREVLRSRKFPPLSNTTYGVEVERYNLNVTASKDNFIRDIKGLAKEEQKQNIRDKLELPRTSQGQDTAALCVIKNSEGNVIMEVRLDGEREIASSKLGADIHDSCFNIEFISVGQGIKRHKEFFEDVAKGQDSEISKIVVFFPEALLGATNDAYVYEFTPLAEKYLVRNELAARVKHNGEEQDIGRETAFHVTHSIPLTDMNNPNAEYIRGLGVAFDSGKDSDTEDRNFTGKLSPTGKAVAKTTFVQAPRLPVQNFTGDRNSSQPLLKQPLEYLVPVEGHEVQRNYLESAERGAVLHPTSNMVEYVRYDLGVYAELEVELRDRKNVLEEEIAAMKADFAGSVSSSVPFVQLQDKQTQKLKGLDKGITKLQSTINALKKISNDVMRRHWKNQDAGQSTFPRNRSNLEDQLRLFESHDEKLQPIITGNGYREGLIELRSEHPLKELIKHHIFPETAPESSEVSETRLNANNITNDNMIRGRKYITGIAEAMEVVAPIMHEMGDVHAHGEETKVPTRVSSRGGFVARMRGCTNVTSQNHVTSSPQGYGWQSNSDRGFGGK